MTKLEFQRQGIHKRNDQVESILHEVNAVLAQAESNAISKFRSNDFPLIFIVGCPRSGTTLFMQWLARIGYFAYPTNLLSRFYAAPYIGAKIQLMLTTHDFNNELYDFNVTGSFESRLGKTKGVLAPHEFFYFWRRFFNFPEIHFLNDTQLALVDAKTFVSELAALEGVFGKPFAMKAMIMNWNIPFLAGLFDKALFINIKRHPFFNIQSILSARKDYYGDVRAWYSFKPPEYTWLKSLNPYEQLAGQVYYTNHAVEKGLDGVHESRKLTVDYELFCESPERVFWEMVQKLELQGYTTNWEYSGPDSFESSRQIALSDKEMDMICKAHLKITGKHLPL